MTLLIFQNLATALSLGRLWLWFWLWPLPLVINPPTVCWPYFIGLPLEPLIYGLRNDKSPDISLIWP